MICKFCGKEIKPLMFGGVKGFEIAVCDCPESQEEIMQVRHELEDYRRKAYEDFTAPETGLSERGKNQTFSSFNPEGIEDIYQRVYNYDPKNGSLLLMGRTGAGKTHLACAVLNKFVSEGNTGRFINFPQFVSERQNNEELIETPLLVIDEIGIGGNEYTQTKLYELVNGRYEKLNPTVYTTNLKKQELLESIGERNYRRIKETCEVILVKGVNE